MSTGSPSTARVGVLLSDDMIFTSRITGTARDLGLCIKPVRSVEALNTLIQEQIPRCLIVDLAHAGLRIADLMQSLRTSCSPMPRLIAYGSHIDTARLREAREAGCDVVLPRSKFVEELPRALPEWLTV